MNPDEQAAFQKVYENAQPAALALAAQLSGMEYTRRSKDIASNAPALAVLDGWNDINAVLISGVGQVLTAATFSIGADAGLAVNIQLGLPHHGPLLVLRNADQFGEPSIMPIVAGTANILLERLQGGGATTPLYRELFGQLVEHYGRDSHDVTEVFTGSAELQRQVAARVALLIEVHSAHNAGVTADEALSRSIARVAEQTGVTLGRENFAVSEVAPQAYIPGLKA